MITIHGIIGSEKDPNGKELHVSLVDVIAQVRGHDGSGELTVLIDSPGGYVDEGFKIHDYLRSLGRPIKTIAQGECMSIATVVFLAGDRRVAGCPLLIHNPWISVKGDSRLLKDAADYMAASEKRLEKFYAEKTGLPAETLSDLMQSDRTITKEESVTLGFATEIFDSKPVAFAHHNINNMTEKEKKELQDKLDTQSKLFDKILAKVGLKRIAKDDETEILALELTTATGETLTVERESGDPQVGDAATPDGEFVLPDGSTIVVADGVITEIRPKEDAPATEDVAQQLAKATARISVLEQQLRTAQAAKLSKEQKEIIDSVQALGGKDVLAKIQSTYKAQARKKDFETPSNPIAERVAKIKEARTKSV